ncbi:WD-40 repeat protein [Scheffersomyces amazonensis]|uniref:WD-40 repeat protein n=1 Tax=Scheffersomyces amazonensis TaxID=1078765 RepID=UPI00315D7125
MVSVTSSVQQKSNSYVRTKKGLSYVLGDTNNSENHILPINAIQYSSYTNDIYTAGRDGTVKVWSNSNNHRNDSVVSNKDTVDSTIASNSSSNDYDNGIFEFGNGGENESNQIGDEYQDIDEKILKLETSISSNPVPYNLKSSNNSNSNSTISLSNSVNKFTIQTSYNIYFDWINDLKLINNDRDLVSCSSDLSIKLINLPHEDELTGDSNGIIHERSHSSNNRSITHPSNININASVHKFSNIHTDYIKKLSYFKDSNHLLSGGLDGNIYIWDLFNLKPIQQISNSTGFDTSCLRSSIYALANNESNLISCGGPNNTINLFDRRSSNPYVRKLIGHQDNIRCLVMNDHFILSGSSDTSIKLWDLRNYKVYKNFDIHDFPVWSLVTESPHNFNKFYSGDKAGNIVKTDLTYLSSFVNENEDIFHGYDTFTVNDNSIIDEKLGISSIISKGNSPILSLCHESKDDTIFASNYEALNRYINPNIDQVSKYQYLRTCLDYSINREQQFNDEIASGLMVDDNNNAPPPPGDADLNSDFYDLISHLSMDTLTNNYDLQSTFSHSHSYHNLFDSGTPPTDKYLDSDNDSLNSSQSDEEYTSIFLNVNGGPSDEFINTYKDESAYNSNTNMQKLNYVRTSPSQEPQASQQSVDKFVDDTPVEILLNPIPADQITLVPFNIKPLNQTKITPKSIISKRFFNNKREILVLYLNGDIKIWDVFMCKEVRSFLIDPQLNLSMLNAKDLDIRQKEMDNIFQKFQSSDTLNNWCDVEIKAGKLLVTIKETSFLNVELYYDDLIKSYPFLALDHPESKFYNYKSKVTVNLDDRFFVGSIFLNSILFQYALLEWEFDKQVREEMRQLRKNNRNLNNTPASAEDMAEASSISSFRRLKYFGRKPSKTNLSTSSQQASPAASTNTSINEYLGSPENPMSDFLNFSEENKQSYDNSIMKLLQTNKRVYWDKYNHVTYNQAKAKVIDSVLHVDALDPTLSIESANNPLIYTPLIDTGRLPPHLLIIIFEHNQDLGNYRDLCSFQLSDIQKLGLNSPLLHDLRMHLPKWIGNPLLYNRYPVKETPKIAFQLLECDYSLLPANKKIGGKTQRKIKKLPVLETSIKLTSHSMLRVGKIIIYLTEKFESKTSEMKDKKMVPTDWLVLECKGQELPNDMTLQTIKTKIWKSSADIELRFRRKFDP